MDIMCESFITRSVGLRECLARLSQSNNLSIRFIDPCPAIQKSGYDLGDGHVIPLQVKSAPFGQRRVHEEEPSVYVICMKTHSLCKVVKNVQVHGKGKVKYLLKCE